MGPTSATAAAPPSTVSPTSLLAQVPDDATWAVAVVAPQAASHAASSFFAGCSQRLLPEQLEAHKARFRRRFGLAPDSLEDFLAAGLDPTAGCVVFATGPASGPLLLARVGDAKRFAAFETGYVGNLPAEAPRGAVGAADARMVRGPYASVAHTGDLVWLEPGGADAALTAAVARYEQRRTLGAGPFWAAPPLGGEGTLLHLFWSRPEDGAATPRGQVATVVAGALGLDVRGITLAAPAADAKAKEPLALPWAQAGEEAWLKVGGQSLAAFAQMLPSEPLPAPAAASPAVQAAMQEGQRRAAHAARALGGVPGVDGPFVARMAGATQAPQWALTWTATREAAAAALLRRLKSKHASVRRLEGTGRAGCEAVPTAGRPSVFVARCGRSLAATGDARALAPLLARAPRPLGARAPASVPVDPSRPSLPLARLSFDPGVLSGHLRRALKAQAPQGPLGEWLPMPQLMLAGPVGDALADLEALGHVDGVLWRQSGRLLWHLQQRRLPGPPP